MPLLIIIVLWIGAESWLLSRLIEAVGGGWVLAWLAAAVVAGVVLIQRQGVRTIMQVRAATARGELPATALLEGVVVIIAGLLLILPGVISDVIALSLLLVGFRKRLAQRLSAGLAKARPDLKQPVTLEGEFRRKDGAKIRGK